MDIQPSFSVRHGYGQPKEITIRDAAPENLRFAFLNLVREVAQQDMGGYPERGLRDVISRELKEKPDSSWHYQEVWEQVERMVYGCDWFRVYDLMEPLERYFRQYDLNAATEYRNRMNGIFVELGVGWQFSDERLILRGDELFEAATRVATQELANRPTTQSRIQEALSDLSRRPKPDFPGAISHAFAAMESVVGSIEYTPEELRDQSGHTLGAYLQHHPDLFLSEDFKEGLRRLWKYANNEGSRHGKEGIQPPREEAEFLVLLAAALVTYLNRKHPA